MGRALSLYTRTQTVNLKINKCSIKIAQIGRHLTKEDGIKATQQAISNFWKRYMKTGVMTMNTKEAKSLS